MNYFYNQIFMWSCRRAHRQFINQLKDAERVQTDYLMQLLKHNANTVFGKQYDFAQIKNIDDFQKNIPLTDYDTLKPLIERQMATAEPILTWSPPLLYELSSGSSAPSKYIPYTDQLKKEYMAAVKPWLFDLYHHYPQLKTGTAYWSISPINRSKKRTACAVPIGFEDDAGYFDSLQGQLLNRLFCVPPQIKHIGNIDDFRYLTLLFMLADASLSYISIWNPTFLTLLLDQFDTWQKQLINDICLGSITPPKRSDIPAQLIKKWRAQPTRAAYLQRITAQCSKPFNNFDAIWPNLQLISCWDQAQAKRDAQHLKRYFKQVVFQGKGLLATEGVVSLPLEGIGNIVSYRSHFYEFIEYDISNNCESGPALCLWQLQKDHHYQVVITTGGGLYRYRLGDIVKVCGFYHGVALLEFIGKGYQVSDLCGEKLNAGHINSLIEQFDFDYQQAFVALLKNDNRMGYCLFINSNAQVDWVELAARFEAGLKQNFHYRYALSLGQLAPLQLFLMRQNQQKIYYQHIANSKNIKLGDIKNSVLWSIDDFDRVLTGQFIDRG